MATKGNVKASVAFAIQLPVLLVAVPVPGFEISALAPGFAY
jgi:hypothetical protein